MIVRTKDKYIYIRILSFFQVLIALTALLIFQKLMPESSILGQLAGLCGLVAALFLCLFLRFLEDRQDKLWRQYQENAKRRDRAAADAWTRAFARANARSHCCPGQAKDFHAVLEVHETATLNEITKAYRRLALSCHPDRFPDDKAKAERFLQIAEAYEALSDSRKTR